MTQSGDYAVITRDSNGCYAKSINYLFTYMDTSHTDTISGINPIGADLGVRLYPVPNQGSFVVEATGLADADLAIYDIYGQRLYQQKLATDHTQIYAADLPAALYFVTISNQGRTQTIKMQVTRE
jgi:hypothetical protein